MGYHRSFFGIGSITAIPSGTNPTPVDIAVIKGASVEFKSTEKELRGNQLFALDSATTSASVSGKIQAADFSASMVSLVIPGTTTATGRNKMAAHSAAIGTTPYQVTVTNSATFAVDFGVLDVTAGKALTRV